MPSCFAFRATLRRGASGQAYTLRFLKKPKNICQTIHGTMKSWTDEGNLLLNKLIESIMSVAQFEVITGLLLEQLFGGTDLFVARSTSAALSGA